MYQIFYLYPNNSFLIMDKLENRHTGWRNPIPDYFFYSIPRTMQGSTADILTYLQEVNSSSKVYYLGEYTSILDFYTHNPHLLI